MVCNLNFSIGLRVGGRGVVVLDPYLLAKIFECVIVELLFIVRDEDLGDSEATNDTFSNKTSDIFLCDGV